MNRDPVYQELDKVGPLAFIHGADPLGDVLGGSDEVIQAAQDFGAFVPVNAQAANLINVTFHTFIDGPHLQVQLAVVNVAMLVLQQHPPPFDLYIVQPCLGRFHLGLCATLSQISLPFLDDGSYLGGVR